MNKWSVVGTFFLLLFIGASQAADFRTIGNGDWNDPAIWDLGTVPTNTDRVFIDHNVTLSGSYTNSTIGQIRVNITGSLFIENITNNGVILNYGLIRFVNLTNSADFLNEGILEVNVVVNNLNGTINNTGNLQVNDELTNATAGFISNIGYLFVANTMTNSGSFELPVETSTFIMSGLLTNEVGGYFKICGRLGLGDRDGVASTNSKEFTNNGTIDGCDGGIAGDNFSKVANNSIVLNTVYVCLESGDVTNGGTGTLTPSCCFLMNVDAGADRRICVGESVTIGGDPTVNFGIEPITYQWSEVGGSVISSDPNPVVSPTINTAYVVEITDSETPVACVKKDTVVVRVTSDVIANAGRFKFLCEGESVVLGGAMAGSCGTAPYEFEWSPADGLDDISLPNPTASPSTTTQYVLKVTDDAGGIARDTTYIFIQPQPPAADAGADQTLCAASNATLAASEVIGGSGEWSVVSSPGTVSFTNNNDPTSDVIGLAPGVTILKWTATSGVCVTEDEVTITVDPLPEVSDAGDDQQLCEQSSTTMDANDPGDGVGEWSITSGVATIVDVNDNQTEVNDLPTDGTPVVLTWTITSGVCGTSTDDVNIVVQTTPPVIDAGADQELCNVDETTLTVTTDAGNAPTTSGVWSLESGTANIVSPNNTTTVVNSLVPGSSATFRYTILGDACDDSEAEVTVTVYEEPSAAQAGADLVFCAGETSARLSATPPTVGTGEWKIDSGTGSFSNINDPTAEISGLATGVTELMWIVSNGACDPSVDVITIEVNDQPRVEPTSTSICAGDEIQLLAVGGDDYLWSPAEGLSQSNIANPVASPESTTTYEVEIIRANCPNETLEVQVTVNPTPVVVAVPADTTINIGQELQLQASGATQYEWSPATGLDDPTSSNPVASPLESITYTVTGTTDFDCSATASVAITVDEAFEIFVPEMFSPNDDGNNDLLFVNTIGLQNVEFKVFDRFGRVIFSTDDPSVGWNGIYKGEKQNIDAYPYVVVGQTFGGQVITKKGTVQLIR